MDANMLMAILTAGDILIDILAPVPEITAEQKVEFRKKLQAVADQSEAWLELELQKLQNP